MKWQQCVTELPGEGRCKLDVTHTVKLPSQPSYSVWGFPHSSSNLVAHVQRELLIIGEEQEVIFGVMGMAEIFVRIADSGGAASILRPQISRLLAFENLSDLSDDPEEWFHHGPKTWGGNDGKGVWQNVRNSAAFSEDGGKTYRLVGSNDWNEIHRSKTSGGDAGKSELEGGDENERAAINGEPGPSAADRPGD